MIDLHLKDYTTKIEPTINCFFLGCSKLRKEVKTFLYRENSRRSPVGSWQLAGGKGNVFFHSVIQPSILAVWFLVQKYFYNSSAQVSTNLADLGFPIHRL